MTRSLIIARRKKTLVKVIRRWKNTLKEVKDINLKSRVNMKAIRNQ